MEIPPLLQQQSKITHEQTLMQFLRAIAPLPSEYISLYYVNSVNLQ